jgi:hypothetical protein
MFCHFDTCHPFNHESAQRLVRSISQVFALPPTPLRRATAPRQTNSLDCGVYVMAMMTHMAEGGRAGEQMIERLNGDFIRKFREEFARFLRGDEMNANAQPME